MSPLIYTVVAVTPIALVTIVTLPIARIGECLAAVAECALL